MRPRFLIVRCLLLLGIAAAIYLLQWGPPPADRVDEWLRSLRSIDREQKQLLAVGAGTFVLLVLIARVGRRRIPLLYRSLLAAAVVHAFLFYAFTYMPVTTLVSRVAAEVGLSEIAVQLDPPVEMAHIASAIRTVSVPAAASDPVPTPALPRLSSLDDRSTIEEAPSVAGRIDPVPIVPSSPRASDAWAVELPPAFAEPSPVPPTASGPSRLAVPPSVAPRPPTVDALPTTTERVTGIDPEAQIVVPPPQAGLPQTDVGSASLPPISAGASNAPSPAASTLPGNSPPVDVPDIAPLPRPLSVTAESGPASTSLAATPLNNLQGSLPPALDAQRLTELSQGRQQPEDARPAADDSHRSPHQLTESTLPTSPVDEPIRTSTAIATTLPSVAELDSPPATISPAISLPPALSGVATSAPRLPVSVPVAPAPSSMPAAGPVRLASTESEPATDAEPSRPAPRQDGGPRDAAALDLPRRESIAADADRSGPLLPVVPPPLTSDPFKHRATEGEVGAAPLAEPGVRSMPIVPGPTALPPRFDPALPPAGPASDASQKPYAHREVARRRPQIRALGGTPQSEASVDRALAWLSRHQRAAGNWTYLGDGVAQAVGFGSEHDMAQTGLSLLAFLAADHVPNRDGPYKHTVTSAADWIVDHQSPDGDLRGIPSLRGAGSARANFYDQGIATLAIAEAAIVTNDRRYTEAALLGAGFICRAQNDRTGGWRYVPDEAGDTSVFGWQIMALHQCEVLGFQTPAAVRERAVRFISLVSSGRGASLAAYLPGEPPSPAMTAEALLCRVLLGQPLTNDQVGDAVRLLASDPPRQELLDLYFWYYASLSLTQLRSEPTVRSAWEGWNNRCREVLIAGQEKDGPNAGSWRDAKWSAYGGRVFATALATLTLEVYYRYLPLQPEDPAAARTLWGPAPTGAQPKAPAKPRFEAN